MTKISSNKKFISSRILFNNRLVVNLTLYLLRYSDIFVAKRILNLLVEGPIDDFLDLEDLTDRTNRE